MAVSRRRFLRTTTTAGAAAAAATIVEAPARPAAAGARPPILPLAQEAPAVVTSATTLPALSIIALNRMGYGPRPGDVAAFVALGSTPDARFQAYVEQQLNPAAISDSECDAKLAAARLRIRYDAKTDDPNPSNNYPARNEAAPLTTLNQTIAELWPRARGWAPYQAWAERNRPGDEVRVATMTRAVYSKRQLQELLIEFWHNHFNVNLYSDTAIAGTFPLYDQIMRKHCLGNFRTMLEEVAKSVAMMYYLDNASNKAGGGEGGNENYSRELFELHTLGSDNYLKFYADRRSIGTITYAGKTYVRGYIDDDIYETARCLSGWTLNDGNWEHPTPNDGTFVFLDKWHDYNQKVVLSADGVSNIPRNGGIADAQKVFDMLAGHPGTARHICTKLCRRLIADNPPASVIDAAVATWMANVSAPDQLKQVVRTILLSNEFKTTWGQKIKRPFEVVVSYLRATGAELPVDEVPATDPNGGGYWGSFFWQLDLTGHRIFQWPTPTGHPDLASYWANTNGMLRRWNLPYILTQAWGGNVKVDLAAQTDLTQSCTAIVDFWIGRLCGFSINPTVRQELISFLAQGGDVNQPPKPTKQAPDWNDPKAIPDRIASMVQLLAMSPDFQVR